VSAWDVLLLAWLRKIIGVTRFPLRRSPRPILIWFGARGSVRAATRATLIFGVNRQKKMQVLQIRRQAHTSYAAC
jgi:hypothetical protein